MPYRESHPALLRGKRLSTAALPPVEVAMAGEEKVWPNPCPPYG